MLMVILGAGASYGSVEERLDPGPYVYQGDYRPPLANDLFSPRRHFKEAIDRFPESAELISRLRYDVYKNKDIEVSLAEIEGEAETDPHRKRQLLALQCYLRVTVGACGERWAAAASGVTNYTELVGALEHWRTVNHLNDPICYVTFNYDTMLEQALERRYPQVEFTNLSSYHNRVDFQLFKPHGSVDGRILRPSLI